jgi:hypothetical protein
MIKRDTGSLLSKVIGKLLCSYMWIKEARNSDPAKDIYGSTEIKVLV